MGLLKDIFGGEGGLAGFAKRKQDAFVAAEQQKQIAKDDEDRSASRSQMQAARDAIFGGGGPSMASLSGYRSEATGSRAKVNVGGAVIARRAQYQRGATMSARRAAVMALMQSEA